jgi:hypothetical protein
VSNLARSSGTVATFGLALGEDAQCHDYSGIRPERMITVTFSLSLIRNVLAEAQTRAICLLVINVSRLAKAR